MSRNLRWVGVCANRPFHSHFQVGYLGNDFNVDDLSTSARSGMSGEDVEHFGCK